ncbi:MAG: hypothetical protein ACTSSL_13135 [Candidatus Heimdallarchaeaceae archaeon]
MYGQGQVPVIVLKEGTERTKGKDAQRNNIMAAQVVAETIKTTLGPKVTKLTSNILQQK